ncbi:bifunctional phosphoribosyl-AMP cyclohydrolase/phosphoribosyl-ATP diphosphatase HisIE [Mobilitalea sibirica]|uniref:Histidine biosynthesis bifunctional protein HisIE n=1 Tax=Mobilitalea sibirica TaxID=1462919 RepID=A0A8J7HE08_9FIRM|nr:bifunctional phosphoribosyl-AMP cyclohydrolase/phosphoribosyl-ATP diphosphatase HisIE [Mobilitalea sibirica]MBH1941449.1 bifunctional phosphoribosyl-AMP cyclohydrolase/phosphoribosyl-ATP diphosphatase HisIE [Mobilitalea sibirica]
MSYKKIIPYINAENEVLANVTELAKEYSYGGADELLIYNYSKDEKSREEFLSLVKEISRLVDIPLIIGCHINRMEDVKKALYTGASSVLIRLMQLKDQNLIKEVSNRFGSDKIMIELDMIEYIDKNDKQLLSYLKEQGVGNLLFKHVALTSKVLEVIQNAPIPVIIRDSLVRNDIGSLISLNNVIGVATNFYENKDILKAKHALKEEGISVNTFESKLPFSAFKTDDKGLIPVITQDFKSGEVLMLAYMNEEAYNKTIAGGRMTYWSRSRNCLWLKGETSGHFQYLKELSLDCDKDTLLAKVLQIGPACHTGSKNCFITNLMEKEHNSKDPFHVFQDVYQVIMDRKLNPKEGSYTNYLFDKGLDKILKKCGEESAEIIIAAKNPGAEELRYEIADYLYHMMVLMAECGLDWKDITQELEHRK